MKQMMYVFFLLHRKVRFLRDGVRQVLISGSRMHIHPLSSKIQTVFLITDYEQGFRRMAQRLPNKTTYQLYRDYLDNFRINHGRN